MQKLMTLSTATIFSFSICLHHDLHAETKKHSECKDCVDVSPVYHIGWPAFFGGGAGAGTSALFALTQKKHAVFGEELKGAGVVAGVSLGIGAVGFALLYIPWLALGCSEYDFNDNNADVDCYNCGVAPGYYGWGTLGIGAGLGTGIATGVLHHSSPGLGSWFTNTAYVMYGLAAAEVIGGILAIAIPSQLNKCEAS